MTLKTTKLVDNRVFVHGTDAIGTHGEVVLDGTQWAELTQQTQVQLAQADFDAEVEKFFAPLTAAAEALGKKLERAEDEAYYVVSEGSDSVAGQQRHVVKLTHDSQILRLIDDGREDRLVWVGDGLEILAPTATTEDVDTHAEAVAADSDDATDTASA